MLHFQYPEYLLSLSAVALMVLCYLYVVSWKKKTIRKIGDPDLVKDLTSEYSPKKFRIKYLLTVAAFILCAFAVAGLIIPDKTQRITRSGTDLMIALDVSKSMLATDIKPDRLERAKQLITKIIDQMPDERIGLVIFAGRAYLQMPMTIDHKAAKMYVSSVSTNDVPTQGTVIRSALEMCLAAFNPQDKSYKSVLLISDGEDHDKDAEKVAKDLAKQGIMVNTIGIGSPMGAPIPDEQTGQYKTDKEGNTVISKLNERELQKIAQATNGIYQLYNEPDQIVDNLKNQLAQVESQSMLSDSSYLSMKQFYFYFLMAAFLLLIAEMLTSETRRKLIKPALMIMLLLSVGKGLRAQSANGIVRDGNELFKNKKYENAAAKYEEAIQNAPDNDVAAFNLGNAQYRSNDLQKAVNAYDLAIEKTKSNALKQRAYYNKGVAYQAADKLPECILAYKNALLLDPSDEAARQNLQRALKKQEQQNKNKEKQDKKNKDQKQDQNKKKDQDKNQQQPKPKPSALSKKDAEEKLKALADKERELQDRLHKMKGASAEPQEKDW